MKEFVEALLEEADNTEAARRRAEEARAAQAALEFMRAEAEKQRKIEATRRTQEEKKRRENEEKRAAWLRGQEWTARMTINTYRWKIAENIKGLESLNIRLFLSTLANPDLDPRIPLVLSKMVEAKKIELAEYLKRELKEKLKGNPYSYLANAV